MDGLHERNAAMPLVPRLTSLRASPPRRWTGPPHGWTPCSRVPKPRPDDGRHRGWYVPKSDPGGKPASDIDELSRGSVDVVRTCVQKSSPAIATASAGRHRHFEASPRSDPSDR